MTKKRMFAAGAAIVLTLGLGAGVAAAQTDPTTPGQRPHTETTQHGTMAGIDMDAMHDQMPDGLRGQCDAAHTDMPADMTSNGQAGRMTGAGMMGAGS